MRTNNHKERDTIMTTTAITAATAKCTNSIAGNRNLFSFFKSLHVQNRPKRLVAAGRDAFHRVPLLAALALATLALALPTRAVTLTTDRPDYYPGQHVTFTGTGWQSN